jgi:hypothetical protein
LSLEGEVEGWQGSIYIGEKKNLEGISANVIWGKIMKRGRENGGKCKTKRKKGERKRKKQEEKQKKRSKRVK